MSNKLKLSSNFSTPMKTKLSESPVSSSPNKSNKYKNFLTSVLTPQSRKWMRRKKSLHSEDSFTGSKYKDKDLQSTEDFSEPGYSSIQDLELQHTYNQESDLKSSVLNVQNSDCVQSSSPYISYECHEERPVPNIPNIEEPIYASVNKQKKKKNRNSAQSELECDKTSAPQHQSTISSIKEDLSARNIVEEQKEEIQLLVERLREVTTENRELHKNIETILREQRWKEDSLHAELKLKISQLEADTHKEVKFLSEQIITLQKERQVLANQIDIMHEEKKLLQAEYESVCAKTKALVPPEIVKKIKDEHQKLLSSLRKKHQEEISHLQQENENILASKVELNGKIEGLQQKVKDLLVENEHLRQSKSELVQEKSRILLQLEESKQLQQETQTSMLALLKMMESIATERDILLSKASYQDEQQHLLKNSIMNYSLNMGRLQEHISNLNKEKLEELQKLRSGESAKDERVKHLYGRHLELLHSKVLRQSDAINGLEAEKSKLEMQLESVWQAACLGKPKLLEDMKQYNL